MASPNPRDYREETCLNAAEEQLLIYISGRQGLSKSAAIRHCIHLVGDYFTKLDRQAATGTLTEL